MTALICPHQPSCPGCPRLAAQGLPPEPLARLQALSARVGIRPPLTHSGPQVAFRRRARLAIRGRADAPKLGIFEAGSHRAVHIPRCLVHHPVINRVAASVRDALARHRVATYSDSAHAGIARYLQVVVERETDRAQITLVTNGRTPDGLAPLFDDLQTRLGPDLHSLWWNGNPEHANTILGPHWQQFCGEPFVVDRSADARIFYPPAAFGQSNPDLATQLANDVRQLSRPGDRVSEYYAGVGAIGLGLVATASVLHLNELGEASLTGLEQGVGVLPAPLRSKVAVHRGPAGKHTSLLASSDFVIADPPRKGLDPELMSALLAAPPRRFAYVSCDINSLERDTLALLSAFQLVSLAAYDLFPHTEHIETMAVFEPARRAS